VREGLHSNLGKHFAAVDAKPGVDLMGNGRSGMSEAGNLPFVPPQPFGRFRSETDVRCDARSTGECRGSKDDHRSKPGVLLHFLPEYEVHV
jgi:hypothetical protein